MKHALWTLYRIEMRLRRQIFCYSAEWEAKLQLD